MRYKETVCSAGMLEDGTWVRIYPLPLRLLPSYRTGAMSKYHWFDMDLVKNTKDERPESYRPRDLMSFDLLSLGKLTTGRDKQWSARQEIVLKQPIYTTRAQLIHDAYDANKLTSLAVFQPTDILHVEVKEATERAASPKKQTSLKQVDLFETAGDFASFPSVPVDFFYVFTDGEGKRMRMKILDWEAGALYWKMLRKYNGNHKKATASVVRKFEHGLVDGRNVYFFLGTTLENHRKKAPNPFTIIGVFWPPSNPQASLFTDYVP